MEKFSFDRLAMMVGGTASRRRVLGGLTAALGAVVLGDAALAKKGDKGKGGNDKPKNRGFNAKAEIEVVEDAEENCQFSESGICTTKFEGMGNAAHLGKATFTFSLTTDWSATTPNGEDTGGVCAPLREGSVATITSVSEKKGVRGSLSFEIAGKVCQVGDNTSTVLTLTDATYTITESTGSYKGASGQGDFDDGISDENTPLFTFKGKVKY